MEVLTFEFFVLSHVRGDHLADLAVLEEDAQPEIFHTTIIGNDGQILLFLATESPNQVFRDPTKSEAAHTQRLPVLYVLGGLLG